MISTAWIIDDDDIYRYGFRKFVTNKVLCKNLFDFGNTSDAIDTLTNLQEALNLPDVIFLSVDMENMGCWKFMNAFEIFKAQRSFKKIAIYLVTSSINYLDIERGHDHPDITDYMIKPLNSQQFIHAFEDSFLTKTA
ncbi:response regulator [Mucilaginibacter polytrichastri]|uniref:Response regulatory domain-containing protein n=1 Tax=Mucilaginibacter polytrichastri TaxID=1302689 RepID=A0A1Q6A0G5_9SPHI|nr:response regulator [Mucilaginibacter polytrichastri]OKS87509.1 hypothetical protein RG47T_2970 [Mucilaginibacter polytrichastri]SFS91526.1 CheY chemotaxis protein or a CheY-like REC (receiver) domain [Mucilaginibacter polytrichastri]